MKTILSSLVILCFFQYTSAQIFPGENLEVVVNGDSLENPWIGGLDLPQFSGGDLNQDGLEDLIIFDRKANKTIVLLKDMDGSYKYAPDLDPIFPQMKNFALFKDYNCDGLVDIFTFVNTGIKVYKQKIEAGEISFELASSILEFDLAGFDVNIYNTNTDIPGIEDVDGDGDIDIAVFYSLGTSMPLYRNMSVENGFGCDSLIFEEYTSCWGFFNESASTNNINFDIACKGGSQADAIPSGGPKHAGSSILLFDPNKDNKMDLLLGDISYKTLVYLQNDNTNLDAHMDSNMVDYTYPAYNTVAKIDIFPSGYYVDVTNDGEKDLLVAPNYTATHYNYKSAWLYENTGDTSAPFNYVQDDFIQGESIDQGSFSYPILLDVNGDSLLDLLVGNGYFFDELGASNSTLAYFENTGTDSLPVFTKIAKDFNLLSVYNLDFIRPTFGDLDGDGDLDMVIGDSNGLIHYFENTAGAGNMFDFTLNQLQYFNIDVGNMAHPQLIDVNKDGLLDLLIGREGSYGEIAYFWNYGTASAPMFSTDSLNNAFGKIQTNEPGFIPGYSAPLYLETDTTDIIYVGNDIGFIASYEVNPDSLKTGSFSMLSPGLLPSKVGIRTNLAIGDINADGSPEYFIGNARGGVNYFSTEAPSDTTIIDTTNLSLNAQSELLDFTLYPNPSSSILQIELQQEFKNISAQIMDVLGREIYSNTYSSKTFTISVSSFSKGVYYMKLSDAKGNAYVKSFLKE